MLRTTMEAFSSVLGGCDSLHVGPFDDVIRPPDDFSRRSARNTQIVLQQEAKLARVVDPAGGSYYVEWLTEQLARKAWTQFQEIESAGGIFQALSAGTPQEQIEKVAASRMKNVATRRDVIVGTNMYPNATEKLLDLRPTDLKAVYEKRSKQIAEYRTSAANDAETSVLDKLTTILDSKDGDVLEACINAVLSGATLGEITRTLRSGDDKRPTVKPLKAFRLADRFETLRRKSDAYFAKNNARPKVFLANMGPLRQHKARADFSTSFVQVAGFETISPKGFTTVEEAAKAAVESGARIVVICSTDGTYPEIVPGLTEAIKSAKPETIVVLAGYPTEQIEAYKQAGVDDFIHVRANCLDLLTNLQSKVL
jgi:methylmalonyl-CoA mutase